MDKNKNGKVKNLFANSENSLIANFSILHKPFSVTPYIWGPSADVYETSEKIVVFFEIAGIKKDDIVCSVNNMSLTIKGIRTEKAEKVNRTYHRMEIHYGPFERNILLPCQVETDNIDIEYNEGILRISLIKKSMYDKSEADMIEEKEK